MVIQNPVINSTANIAAYMKLLMHFSPYTMHICPPEHSYIVPLSFFQVIQEIQCKSLNLNFKFIYLYRKSKKTQSLLSLYKYEILH